MIENILRREKQNPARRLNHTVNFTGVSFRSTKIGR
jgi:hypothetical protein